VGVFILLNKRRLWIMKKDREFYNDMFKVLKDKYGKDGEFGKIEFGDLVDSILYAKQMKDLRKSNLDNSMKNIVDVFKSEEMKQSFINASQFGEDLKKIDLKFLDLYMDYENNTLGVLTKCKNTDGEDVTKSISYKIKGLGR
jgi:hypothetical protein